MSIHWELKPLIDERYRDRLSGPCELKQDALLLGYENGLEVELRFASAEEYSIRWTCDGYSGAIDTAPSHPQLSTRPNHLHAADGSVWADPLTQPGAHPWDNLCAVLDALLAGDPALGSAPG